MRKLFVEFLGTAIFVLVIIGVVVSDAPLAPIAIGSALMVMVYAGGHISGGHYNPGVSLGAALRGAMPVNELVPYWVAQLAGALLAALLGRWLFDSGSGEALNVIDNGTTVKALMLEALFTFALVWVVLHTATAKDTAGNSNYGLAIGFTVLAGVVAAGAISGGAFNFAVAFGLTVSGQFAWAAIWVYLIANVVGGVLAAYAFTYANGAHRAVVGEA